MARFVRLLIWLGSIVTVSLLLVWAVYQVHTANLPVEFQHRYNEVVFSGNFGQPLPVPVAWTQDHSCVRGLSWYLTGLYAQGQHWLDGHPMPTYLLGQGYKGGGNPLYFPILFLTKEPTGFLLLCITAVISGAGILARRLAERGNSLRVIVRRHFLAVSFLLFVTVYFSIAAGGALNLGIRHLIPAFPFLYLLVALVLVQSISQATGRPRKAMLAAVALLATWGSISSLASWPGYLAFFNELAGGKENGASITQGSNYDWGTDMLRLQQYLERNNISDVYLINSGTYSSYYYLGGRAHSIALPERPPSGELIAVSMKPWQRVLCDWQGKRVRIKDSDQWRELPRKYEPDQISWFCTMKPFGKVGDSILLFRAP